MGKKRIFRRQVTKKAVRAALEGISGWSFGYATSPAAWRKNPVLNVSSWVVSEEWAARVGAALASVGLTVTGMIMEKPPVTSRFILGLKELPDDNRR